MNHRDEMESDIAKNDEVPSIMNTAFPTDN